MISVKNVGKTFGTTLAVKDISFDVQEGENFILLGTSGCGKTTTLRMINRLIETSEGKITVDGQDIKEQSPERLRRNMGYVTQRNSLFPHYTVAENISVVPGLLRWDKERTGQRIQELMSKLHLPQEYLKLYPGGLSGGEAQRVNLARALVADPAILLMDEPFSALDPIIRTSIRKEFYELDELRKKTIIMVTHDVQEAFEMGNRICLMDKGEIMQTGTPAELLFGPANDFVKHFLSDAFVQLSFTITRIQDMWAYLPDGTGEGRERNIPLPATSTLWKAVEQVRDKNDKRIKLLLQHEQGMEKQVSWEDLLTAFSKYQINR